MNPKTTLIALTVAALTAGTSVTSSKATPVASTDSTPQKSQKSERRVERKEERDMEKRVRMENLPAPVQQTVREQSKGATVRGLSQETEGGKTNYEVELKVNGHNKDVLIDPTGAVVEIEEQVSLTSLPQAVRVSIEQKAGTGKIIEVESITKGGAVAAYEAHVRKAGKKSEIKVGPDGQLITPDKD
jgi:uncharacterized membrane protein YkoI